MANSHRFAQAIIVGDDTRANLIASTTYARQIGELAIETGTTKLYVAKSLSGGDFKRVHGLDLAVTYEDEVVVNSGEVVWNND